MSSQQYIPPETAEQKEARLAKRAAEAQSRHDYLWGNYQREHLNGGSGNGRMFDWSQWPSNRR